MPESLYQDVASAHFSEYTLLRAWMKQWLNSVQWYYTNALNLALPFERFLSAPVVQHHWKVRTEDPLLNRFGLMWRLFDEVGKWNRRQVYYRVLGSVIVRSYSGVSPVRVSWFMPLGLTSLRHGVGAFILSVTLRKPSAMSQLDE